MPRSENTIIRVRTATPADERFLLEMLYCATHSDLEPGVTPEHLLTNPALARYVSSFGRDGDLGVVALPGATGDEPVGAAWVRLLVSPDRGYGWVDDAIPELAIAVAPSAIGSGVGTAMLTELLRRARERYPGVSLSVRSTNPAHRLYIRLGFEDVARVQNRVGGVSHTMVLRFA
jgi:ribosomal protein S18 acetylase RimI-like enzyme